MTVILANTHILTNTIILFLKYIHPHESIDQQKLRMNFFLFNIVINKIIFAKFLHIFIDKKYLGHTKI